MVQSKAQPLHVLHLLNVLSPGGVSRYVLELNRGLHDAGHRTTTVGAPDDWQHHFETASGRTIIPSEPRGPLAMWRLARRLAHELREPVDIIHAHHRRSALIGRQLARRWRVPLLFSLHMPTIPMGLPRRWLSDFGDHTHTPSEEARQWLIEAAHVPDDRITVIPHGIDPSRFPRADEADRLAARHALGLPADAPVAAFVGRFAPSKNVPWMLDLAKAARDRLPTLRVLLMGTGEDEPALRQRIAQDNLQQHVHLLDWNDPLSVYRACDLLLLPSAVEAFALVASEAMSVGRPVLRTRTGGWRSQIVETPRGPTGQAVAVDRDAFLNAALALLEDRLALHRMGEAAAEHARTDMTIQQQVARTLELYEWMRKGGSQTPQRREEHEAPNALN